MQIVNGYVCFTTCDASAARKGHDPRNPTDDPAKTRQLAGPKAIESGEGTDAVVRFGGALSSRDNRGTTTDAKSLRLVDRLA